MKKIDRISITLKVRKDIYQAFRIYADCKGWIVSRKIESYMKGVLDEKQEN